MTTLALYLIWASLLLGAIALLVHLVLNLPWGSE
jgi:hypothetical protein